MYIFEPFKKTDIVEIGIKHHKPSLSPVIKKKRITIYKWKIHKMLQHSFFLQNNWKKHMLFSLNFA